MSKYQQHILTNRSLVIIFNDRTVSITAENKVYGTLRRLLDKHEFDKLEAELDLAAKISNDSNKQFQIKDNFAYINGVKLPAALSNRLIDFARNRLPYEPLIKFWQNLSNNPSEDSRQDLFGFLHNTGIPITEDGCFIAYKKVRPDFKDFHTGKFDNRPGKEVKEDRKYVNPDRKVACARGLHVCSFKYLREYRGDVDHIVIEVKVNPRDVVTVPVDHYGHKMRLCRYKVIRVCDREIDGQLYDAQQHKKTTQTVKKQTNKRLYDTKKYSQVKQAIEKQANNKQVVKNVDHVKTIVTLGNRNRIRISTEVLAMANIDAGAYVKCFVNRTTKQLIVSDEFSKLKLDPECWEGAGGYTVCDDRSVKIGHNVLRAAGLEKEQRFVLTVEARGIIKISKVRK